jgi:hypothetical protein
MRNYYLNLWAKDLNLRTVGFYENDARPLHEFDGVTVFKQGDHSFDYVFAGACITQRAGCSSLEAARAVVADIFSGEQPVSDAVAAHLVANGIEAACSYSEYHTLAACGLRK